MNRNMQRPKTSENYVQKKKKYSNILSIILYIIIFINTELHNGILSYTKPFQLD